MSALTIRIRRHQHTDKDGNAIFTTCYNNVIGWAGGTIDQTWHDVTEDTDGLDALEVIIRSDPANEKVRESATTLSLTFTGTAGNLIKDHLTTTDCDYVNYFDCEITDNICGITYRNYELKADNLEYCEGDGCSFSLSLREADEKARAIKKISIHDNWQNWFKESGSKDHPTFQVVLQKDPTQVGMQGGLILALQAMLEAPLGLVGWLFGKGVTEWVGFEERIKKILGFGYYAPAPRIYDILLNAATRLGLSIDTPFNPGRELYNDCLLTVPAGAYHKDFDYSPAYKPSPSTKFIESNGYTWPVNEFLDELCRLYNAKWDIIDGVLRMTFNKDTIAGTAELELADDYSSLCYEFSLAKKPAYGRYEYAADPGDSASGSVNFQYNDLVDYDSRTDNPMLEGDKSKIFKFASTGFYCDSIGQDNYIDDVVKAMKIGATAILATLGITTLALAGGVLSLGASLILGTAMAGILVSIQSIGNDYRNKFSCSTQFAGIVRVSYPGIINTPRILRYDPATPLNNAKVVSVDAAIIPKSARYNTTLTQYGLQFDDSVLYKKMTRVYNYPLFFDSWYVGNLYDTYHEFTDSPMFVNYSNRIVTIVLPLCCGYLSEIGIDSGTDTLLGKIVKLPNGKYFLVDEATISYSAMSITLKGQQIYRA